MFKTKQGGTAHHNRALTPYPGTQHDWLQDSPYDPYDLGYSARQQARQTYQACKDKKLQYLLIDTSRCRLDHLVVQHKHAGHVMTSDHSG
jgi:hypothetical protein